MVLAKRVGDRESLGTSGLMESFSGNMRARTEHTLKIHVGCGVSRQYIKSYKIWTWEMLTTFSFEHSF